MGKMIPLFKVFMPGWDYDSSGRGPLRDALHDTLYSGYIAQGPRVAEFEQKFGEYIGWDKVVAVNSGTSALTMALRLAGVGEKDLVITTPMTCTATNLPILSLGAVPVFADIHPETGLIDVEAVDRLLSQYNAAAIMAVDWGGTPCDYEALMQVARRYGVRVIRDAAHSLGSSIRDRMTGRPEDADFTCFSLQAIKHITTGDGGMLAVSDSVDLKRARLMRWFGINREGDSGDSRINEDIYEWGYKFHMNDIAATIGLAQMPHLEEIVGLHRRNALTYKVWLSDYFVKPPVYVSETLPWSSWWVFTILLPSEGERDGFKKYMLENGIQVSQVHRRNDDYTVFKPYAGEELPGLEYFSRRMVCLPCHWGLSSDDVNKVIDTANMWAQRGDA